MSEEFNEEQQCVEILWEDGTVVKCEIYDVIDFEGKTYALLIPLEESNEDEEVIVMEYVEEDDDNGFFRSIEDEEEFNRVCEYVQTMEEEDDYEDEEE